MHLVLLPVAYLLGTIPTGLLVVRRMRGVDIRSVGSGNIGATNVIRAVGWGPGLSTLLLDALKGALVPAILGFLDFSSPAVLLRYQLAAGALSLAGNIFNPFLRFRGGKGVGTAIGVAAVIAPLPLAMGFVAFALGFGATRIVSVGSLAAGLAFAACALVVYLRSPVPPPAEWLFFCVAVGLLVLVTHRVNIRRLIAGTEPRLTRRD